MRFKFILLLSNYSIVFVMINAKQRKFLQWLGVSAYIPRSIVPAKNVTPSDLADVTEARPQQNRSQMEKISVERASATVSAVVPEKCATGTLAQPVADRLTKTNRH